MAFTCLAEAPGAPHYNFAAGPSALPPPVLAAAREALGNWDGLGHSVVEVPFSSDEHRQLQQQTEQDLRRLLQIPDSHAVLFMQGGAYAQFALLPLNLLRGRERADYLVTGHWSRRAAAEGRSLRRCPCGRRWIDAALYPHPATNELAPRSTSRLLPLHQQRNG